MTSSSVRERRLAHATWILAAAMALLGIYVYLVEVKGGERQDRALHVASHILPFRPEDVTELSIEPAGAPPGQRVTCVKLRGEWRITAPIRSAADDTAIERLLKDASESKIDRTLQARDADPGRFGLDHALTVRFASGSQREVVRIGKANPTSSFVFASRQTAGEPGPGPVLLVDQRLKDAVDKKLYDLREKAVLDFRTEDVTRITLQNGARTVRLHREPAKGDAPPGWREVEPLRVRADRGAVERSLNLMDYVRAESFASEKPERLDRYGLDQPWGSARFDLTGGRSETLLLGRKTIEGALTRYYARKPGSGPVVTINDNLARDVQQKPEEWRERHATDFTRADAAELRIISPDRAVVCAKRTNPAGSAAPAGDDWGVAEFKGQVAEGMELGAAARMPAAQHAEQDRVTDLLAHLGTLEVKQFLDGAHPGDPRFGLTKPLLKVVAFGNDKKELASVSFGNRQGDRVYATGPHLGGVFLVPAADVERFRTGLRELAARP